MSSTLHRLWHAQAGRCWYCEADTYLPASGETKTAARQRFGIALGSPGASKSLRYRYATIEHLKRRADGGTMNDGVVMACLGCNSRREDATPKHHKIAMRALVEAGTHPSHFVIPPKLARKAGRRKLWNPADQLEGNAE